MADRTPAQVIAFLKTARERFEQGQTASHKQRQRVLDDLKFYAGGEGQWDPDTLRNRQSQQGVDGMPPVPARPCLTINKVREPVHQVLNQERQQDMGIQLVPADDWGDLAPPVSEDEIELREGLVRRIQRESEAADARTWAFARAAIAGEGYYRILTRYVPGKSWDKEVFVARIFNQASVTLDPAHEQPDGSDAEWAFVGGDIPWDRYKREFKRKANGEINRTADDDTFRALGEEYPGWFTETGSTRSARVVEYFYTDYEMRTLCKMVDGAAFWEDELPDDLPDDAIVETREEPKKTIKWAKIDATQILDETEWEGPDMTIVKIVGEELQPFDAERRVEGMVRPARDAQAGYNAMVSKWVEMVGLAPIPPIEMPEENIGPYGQWYQLATTRTLAFLPYISYDSSGRQIPKPSRTTVTTDIAAVAASVQMFDEAVKSTTMVPSVQLGQATDAHLKSGKAIDALKEQGVLGTSHLLDNLRRSIRYEGQIINNLLYPIYGRPGRLARMLTGEGEPQTVRIGAQNNGGPPQGAGTTNGGANVQLSPPGASVAGGGTGAGSSRQSPGMPLLPPAGGSSAGSSAGPMGTAPMGAPPLPVPASKPAKTYVLTKDANFNVIVKVTRSSDSRREDEVSIVGDMLQANPQLMTWYGDLFFKNQDGPGHEEMAERAEVMLDPKIQALRQQKQQGGQDVPPEVMAQLATIKKQLDDAHQIMDGAKKELKDREESHQREQQTKIQIASMEIASKEKIAAMDREAKITVAELGAKIERLTLFLEERGRIGAQVLEHQHEATMNVLDHAQELDKMQQGHEHALEAGAQPPPLDPNKPPPQPEGAQP